MKIWLIVALLAVATSVAVAAVAAEADSTKTDAKTIEAETDLPPSSTDVDGDDEGSEPTESSAAIVEDERNEKKKMKEEKREPSKEGEQEEGKEEEEEENEEEENEDSEEGDSDEDSEEEESKGKEKKHNKTKIESEEEGDIKEDAGPIKTHQPPVQVATRSRTFATAPVPQPDKTREPKWYFNTPNSKWTDVPAKVESLKFDFTETSTRAAVHQVWSSSAGPVAKSVAVETRPTSRPTDVTPSDTRKPHHPKWFFNTAKEKSSDGSTKIESPKPTAIFEIPTRKAAANPIPTWPSITTAKPALAVASNRPADFSHSDNRRSHSHWYFNTPSKPSDGFAKKESNTKPAAIEIPTRNGPAGSHHATHPWAPSSSRPVAPVPVYKPLEVTPSPPRKQYPRWFFNIKS